VAGLIYLGTKLGLLGKNQLETIKCHELLCEIMDLRNKMTGGFCYSQHEDIAAAAAKLLRDTAGIFEKLSLVLAANVAGGGSFFVGDSATAPDFHAWEMFEQYSTMASFFGLPPALESFPNLAAFHSSFKALPQNAKYFSSPLYTKLPFNNKIASFGATVDGSAWTRGMEYDFGSLSGTY
jgi:Glutathione S-transferase, C-terminal domain